MKTNFLSRLSGLATAILAGILSASSSATAQHRVLETRAVTVVPACGQDPAFVAEAIEVIRQVPNLVDQSIDWAEAMGRIMGGGIWPMWFVRYADGTVVYNKFRFYRNSRDVLEYWVGRSPRPDTDAYMLVCGRKVHVLYDENGAKAMTERHGKIVTFGCLEKGPR